MDDHSPGSLILIEGLPGSGKSTLAHFLIRHYAAQGIAARWWYEEEAAHPLYPFHDRASLQQVLDRLASGEYQQVIDGVLDKWQEFAHTLEASGAVVILDSCLFGYLTWTLFPYDVPRSAIDAYLTRVARIIRDTNPRLIYLYQDDVAGALRRICARRGITAEQRLIRNATESAYGKRRGLQGFDGMASLWRAYRAVTDRAFSRFAFPRMAIENSAGHWPAYQRRALEFLGLPAMPEAEPHVLNPEPYVGEYHSPAGDGDAPCRVLWEDGRLVLDGESLVWPRNPLVPVADGSFAVESFPFVARFEEGDSGAVERMIVTGPPLLPGTVDNVFVKAPPVIAGPVRRGD
jgi:thymidylate kinase